MNLVVVVPFASHRRGDIITDGAMVTAILADERAAFVRRVPAAAEPAPPVTAQEN